MEQFRQIGEVLGSLKALMVFRDNIQINPRQCCLLLDVFSFAYDSIAEEMRQNLKFEEKNVKWRILEQPLREIYRIFKEGEGYIKQCLETKDWWAKAITLYQNSYCVEFYIHNLLSCIPAVIESIEIAGEFSGLDQDEIQKKRLVYSNKYQKEWKDPRLFQWKFSKQYLISQELCNRYNTVWKEDRWVLLNKILEKKMSGSTKQERQLTDILLKKLGRIGASKRETLTMFNLSTVQGLQCKETPWEWESVQGDTMAWDLCSCIRETCGPRKRIPFSLPIAVDLMLQISRGMEYLHSKEIFHGNLNPSNILVKPRNITSEGYLHAKVSGFGLSSIKNFTPKNSSNQNETLSFIWILRYVKRFLIMNPDYNIEPEPPMPVIDYGDMETKLLRKFPSWDTAESSMVAQIPFQMFVYRVVEKEKARTTQKETSESGSDKASFSGMKILPS
ncbi:mitogen-activated protein kinase kinase kinase 7-like [Populus alba x Populus x berolinensis]|nr:mitogen-activated protein kinase kinase kinase 7-like [Populus alba x Populus x berolinensis]